MDRKRVLIVLVLLAAVAAFFVFDLKQYISLEFFQQQRANIDAFYAENPWQTAAIYFAIYVAMAALSIPGATVVTLVGGAIFGLVVGVVLVSFASAIGATLAFLASRLLLRDVVQRKFGDRLAPVNAGVEKEGAFYLFALRLVPLFPFFVVNLLMGLTKIRTVTFYWVSQLGMLAGTIVYVYAGTKLGEFRISAGLVIAFVLLGIFPLVAKKVLDAIKARKVYAKWNDRRPTSYDYNLVVIGAGSAGLVSAYIARGDQGQGRADREAQDGRRLPEHRLRAVEGADPLGQAAVAHRALARIRHRSGEREVRLRRRDAARVARHQGSRAARFGRALQRAWRRVHRRHGEDHDTVDGGGRDCDGHKDADAPSRSRSPPARVRSCRRFRDSIRSTI